MQFQQVAITLLLLFGCYHDAAYGRTSQQWPLIRYSSPINSLGRRQEPLPLILKPKQLPMKRVMMHLRGTSSRITPQYLKPSSKIKSRLPSPSPTLLVKPYVASTESNHPTPLTSAMPAYIKLQTFYKPEVESYAFDKPAASNKLTIKLPVPIDVESGAIRTVPAPNLSVKDNKIQFFSKTRSPSQDVFQNPFKKPASISVVPQYEVQEHSNDVTIKDPYPLLFAPDPDTSLPNPKLVKVVDSFSIPSNQKPPANQYFTPAYLSSQYTPLDLYSQPMNQVYTYVPAPILHYYQPDGTMLKGMAPYNPSLIVAQSNDLYNQYQSSSNYKPVSELQQDLSNYNSENPVDDYLYQIQNLHAYSNSPHPSEQETFQISANDIVELNTVSEIQHFGQNDSYSTTPSQKEETLQGQETQTPYIQSSQQNEDETAPSHAPLRIYVPDDAEYADNHPSSNSNQQV